MPPTAWWDQAEVWSWKLQAGLPRYGQRLKYLSQQLLPPRLCLHRQLTEQAELGLEPRPSEMGWATEGTLSDVPSAPSCFPGRGQRKTLPVLGHPSSHRLRPCQVSLPQTEFKTTTIILTDLATTSLCVPTGEPSCWGGDGPSLQLYQHTITTQWHV